MSGGRFYEVFRYLIPVDDLPECLNVVRPLVLIVQIVSVLPDVEAQNWSQAAHVGAVLVCCRGDLKLSAVINNKPSPTRTELCGRCVAELLFEAVKRSEEHTSELQSRGHLVCRLLLEKKKQ